MSLTEEEISNYISTFINHDVKVEFDDAEKFINCMEQLEKKVEARVSRRKFHDYAVLRLKEYGVDDMKLISTGIGYPLRFFDYCPFPKVKECINIVLQSFNALDQGVALDFMAHYGVMYAGDTDRYEGAYFWLNKEYLYKSTAEERRWFFENFYVGKTHINFLLESDTVAVFDYIGFNKKNLISKYALAMPYCGFIERNPLKYYHDYCNIHKVIDMLSVKTDDDWMSLQLAPGKDDYLAIETFMEKHDFDMYTKLMMENDLITMSQYENLSDFDFGELHQFVIKFRWDDKNTFSIKVYTEEFLR